ncbi:cytochrome P450 [Streptomyces violaceusniger]|uniref:Cytochrome P450 n=1 Tax=Streptomyces violaceusniger (strain Tu 4113) TaxID=653045 RepID=G2NU99_STRV4|nr:cytochrome P450 [Streptomyces violaceusniger]AEM84133.1 cytochrome P450 [Streptomyces violaceusniger Tu 4113]
MTNALAGTSSKAIPDFPMPREAGCPFAPPPQLRQLHAEQPLTKVRLWDGGTPWLVTRFEDQRALLADQRCSVDLRRPGFPYMNPAFRESGRRGGQPSFLNMDDPEHARVRRMLSGAFTIKRVEALRPAVQRMTDDFIDTMLAGPKPADLVRALALPLPSLVICEQLGVPYEDHDFFQHQSEVGLRHDVSPEESGAARRALLAYVSGQIEKKLANPSDDLLSELASRVREGDLTHEEAAAMGLLLLGAGHETSANMIALSVVALLENPDQLAIVRDTDDQKVLAKAADELLRYLTIIHIGNRRIALEDIEIGGRTIRAGEGMVLPSITANWQDDVFPDPDRLDLTRDARQHQAFGFGIHQCLGQPLARLELQVVYGTLFRRIPTLRLATDLEKLPFKEDGLVYGVYELPVTW